MGTMSSMSEESLPLALRRRADRDAVREDIAPYLGTSVEQRATILAALCRLAAEQIAARADGMRVLQQQDRRSPESERLWLRLVTGAR
jgi:hypothetical protein